MNKQSPGIKSILDDLGIGTRNVSLVAIGAGATELSGIATGHTFETLSGPDDLPSTLRVDLGIVFAPLDSLTRADTEQLLSRLRDVHCERVLLLDTAADWNQDELRALGYLEVVRARDDVRCYLFDPDQFNQPREWNNPSDWANPENFRKYRW